MTRDPETGLPPITSRAAQRHRDSVEDQVRRSAATLRRLHHFW